MAIQRLFYQLVYSIEAYMREMGVRIVDPNWKECVDEENFKILP